MNIHSGFTFRPGIFAQIVSAVFGVTLAFVISSSALASDEAPEVKVAVVHAGLAAAEDGISGVHMHLHQTMNCLVGPNEPAFAPDEINPCEGMGNGAIPDTTDHHDKEKLEKAAGWVKRGLNSDNYDEARKAANKALKLLKAQES